jgi:hypothetical protein
MSDDYKLQVSIKTPAGTMVNIRANDGDELAAGIRQTTDNLPGITELEALAGAVQTVNNAFQPSAQAPQSAPAQAQQQAPAAVPGRWVPDGGIPVCEHGPFVYNSGNKNGAVWEGYFCPAQKGDPSQHKPVFKPRQGWGK